MDFQSFAYWLQGFAEISSEPPTPEQWQIIKDHLALVFTKVTPDRSVAPDYKAMFRPVTCFSGNYPETKLC